MQGQPSRKGRGKAQIGAAGSKLGKQPLMPGVVAANCEGPRSVDSDHSMGPKNRGTRRPWAGRDGPGAHQNEGCKRAENRDPMHRDVQTSGRHRIPQATFLILQIAHVPMRYRRTYT